jgi:hypothetical protein
MVFVSSAAAVLWPQLRHTTTVSNRKKWEKRQTPTIRVPLELDLAARQRIDNRAASVSDDMHPSFTCGEGALLFIANLMLKTENLKGIGST